ncbi:MAG: MATE family efflux transporter [Myxococcales bacterium]|nr:MAG: MATE family efflux transporter [Myxococcales bacterium]
MLSQNALNLVDTAMVGRLGPSALAAVGLGGISNFVLSAIILGLGTGVQATAARRLGEQRDSETAIALNGGLLLALSLALPWSLFLYWRAPDIFAFLISDHKVLDQGVPYLRMRMIAMLAMGMNASFRGYWNATNRSGLYMRTLIVMHLTNVFLNWIFIFGKFGMPAMGVTGAGLSSAIATYLGTLLYFFLGWSCARENGFLSGLPTRRELKKLFLLSLPACLQQFFFAAGMTAFMWMVGRMSTDAVAITHVVVNLMLVGVLPSLGFGMASASLVGQAMGRADNADAKRWAWDVAKIGCVVVACIALPALIAPKLILSVFLKDPRLLALAVWPLRIVAVSLAFDTFGTVFMHSMLGAGDTSTVMKVSFSLQWILFLPLVYLVGPVLGWGLVAVWGAQGAYRVLQSGVFLSLWQRGGWQVAKV